MSDPKTADAKAASPKTQPTAPPVPAKVKAVVVRGSYNTIDEFGTRRIVHPGQGEDSEVMVTEEQLKAAAGTLARPEQVAAEAARVASEAMQSPTPTDEATTAPSAKKGK